MKDQKAEVRLDLKWTFPLARAEIITGDGREIKRKIVDLSATESFGEKSLKVDVDVTGERWLRVEVWDIATNGAFTQPVYLHEADLLCRKSCADSPKRIRSGWVAVLAHSSQRVFCLNLSLELS